MTTPNPTTSVIMSTFTGQNFTDIANIVNRTAQLRSLGILSDSILKTKTTNYSAINYLYAQKVREELIDYVFRVFSNTFGNLLEQVEMTNRLRYLQGIAYNDIIADTYLKLVQSNNFDKTAEYAALVKYRVTRKIPDGKGGYRTATRFQYQINSDERLAALSPDSGIDITPVLNTDFIGLGIDPSLAVLRGYNTNPIAGPRQVYDLTEVTKAATARRGTRAVVSSRTDNVIAANTVGIRFDPTIANRFLSARLGTFGIDAEDDAAIELIDGNQLDADQIDDLLSGRVDQSELFDTFTEEEVSQIQDLLDDGTLSENEFLDALEERGIERLNSTQAAARRASREFGGPIGFTAISVSFKILQRTKATDLFNALNGRVRNSNYSLYLRVLQDENRIYPIGGGLYKVLQYQFAEYPVPVFNFNIPNGSLNQLIFKQDARRTFNIENI